MSDWHVNAAWTRFYAFDFGAVHWVDCSDTGDVFDIDTRDILSDPDVDTLLAAALALWPRGSAWGAPGMEAPGNDTVLAGLTRAILSPLTALFARAWQLTLESRASSLVDSLDDWERDYGLPDPCVTEPQTIDQRKTSLRARVARLATITPADIVRLAASLGYVVAVEEPEPFRVGETPLGWGELSNAAIGQQWVVHIHDAPVWAFEVGISEVGVDRLLDFDNGVLECAIRRVSPAWTMLVFSVANLPELRLIVTEEGRPLITENGHPIMAVVIPS